MTFKEVEKLLISNGWYYKDTKGSHKHYVHNEIPGKITIPKHRRRCEEGNTKFDTEASGDKIIPLLV